MYMYIYISMSFCHFGIGYFKLLVAPGLLFWGEEAGT